MLAAAEAVGLWWILFWSFSFCVSANLTTIGDEHPCDVIGHYKLFPQTIQKEDDKKEKTMNEKKLVPTHLHRL